MLSSLLPGLRDLRTPLTVGFLWLTSLWVVFGPQIPSSTSAADGLALELFRLAGAFGAPILLAASTFAAYIIGLMTSWLHLDWLRGTNVASRRLWFGLSYPGRLSETTRADLYGVSRPIVDKAIETDISTEDFKTQLNRGARSSLIVSSWTSSISVPPVEDWHSYEVQARQHVVDQAIAEAALTAVRLHAKFSQLWDEYDRAKAEAEFRRGIAIPLAVLIAVTGLAVSDRAAPFSFLGWLPFFLSIVVAFVVAVSLQYFSWLKEFESNENVLQSVVSGEITSPIFDGLSVMIKDKAAGRASALEMEQLAIQEAKVAKIREETRRAQSASASDVEK